MGDLNLWQVDLRRLTDRPFSMCLLNEYNQTLSGLFEIGFHYVAQAGSKVSIRDGGMGDTLSPRAGVEIVA